MREKRFDIVISMSRKVENYKNEKCEKCGAQAVDRFRGQYICADCLNPDIVMDEEEIEAIVFRKRTVVYPETHKWGEPTEVKEAYKKLREKLPIKDWNFYADIER